MLGSGGEQVATTEYYGSKTSHSHNKHTFEETKCSLNKPSLCVLGRGGVGGGLGQVREALAHPGEALLRGLHIISIIVISSMYDYY